MLASRLVPPYTGKPAKGHIMTKITFPDDATKLSNLAHISEATFKLPQSQIKDFTRYLADRGIPQTVAADNHISPINQATALKLLPKAEFMLRSMDAGIILPYFDYAGNALPYFGIRILSKPGASFGAKTRKYLVPSGTPHLYIPLSNPAIKARPRCVITESAVKALAASLWVLCDRTKWLPWVQQP